MSFLSVCRTCLRSGGLPSAIFFALFLFYVVIPKRAAPGEGAEKRSCDPARVACCSASRGISLRASASPRPRRSLAACLTRLFAFEISWPGSLPGVSLAFVAADFSPPSFLLHALILSEPSFSSAVMLSAAKHPSSCVSAASPSAVSSHPVPRTGLRSGGLQSAIFLAATSTSGSWQP
jgi:hypothetical protein